jgi:hypothetical protein
MTQDIPGISFNAQSISFSAATGVPGRRLVLSFGTTPRLPGWPHPVALAQLFAYPLYQQQTDPPREACRAQTATAMRSARTRCFPSCLTPGLCPCGHTDDDMGISFADTLGARMGLLVKCCRGETRASTARDPAHWRLDPCRG